MAYEPTDWNCGDVISAERLNHMEQGISNGGGGSSDFSTAEVTVVNNSSPLEWVAVVAYPEYNLLVGEYDNISSGTYIMPLYKGRLILSTNGSGNVSVSGNCEYADDQFIITGDCTITIS